MNSPPQQNHHGRPPPDETRAAVPDGTVPARQEAAGKLIATAQLLEAAGWCVVAGLPSGLWIGEHAAASLADAATACGTWTAFLKHSRQLHDLTIVDPHARIAIWKSEPAAATPAPAIRLTARETEIQRLLKEGKTGAEIAIITGCKPRTVGKHIENLYKKTGARNRAGAIFSDPPNPLPPGGA